MEYTIQKLARLAGISARTLRWYDRIGLLKPGRIAENGYRVYGAAEVDRLQQILFYRALGVELARIGQMLDDPSFDRLAALREHLAALEVQQARLDRLMATLRKTILAEERSEHMTDAEKFEGFKQRMVAENEAVHGEMVRRRYGDEAMEEANACMLAMTPEQHRRWKALEKEIKVRLAEAVRAGDAPEGEEGRAIAELHREWLDFTVPQMTAEIHASLADMYIQDERFTVYYDSEAAGCAAFLSQAIHERAKKAAQSGKF